MSFQQVQQETENNEYRLNETIYNDYGNLERELFTTNFSIESLLNLEMVETNNLVDELQEGIETLRVMTWNASGLANNLDRLVRRMKRDKVHITIVTESWFHPERHIPEVSVFNSIGAVSPNLNRGTNGVSVVINPDLSNCPHIKNMACIAKDTVNGCFLTIQFAGIKIVGIYNAPSHPLDIDVLLDEIALSSRLIPDESLIFAGDFNARRVDWHDTSSNSAGNKLDEWMTGWNLDRFDTGTTPTCTTVRGSSIVDHVFSNLPELAANIVPSPVPLTDHVPIMFEFFPRIFNYIQPDRSYIRVKKENLRDKDTRIHYGFESMRTQETLRESLNALEDLLSTGIGINEQQQAIDMTDKSFGEYFLHLGKRILGETRAGKRKTQYEPLHSEHLETLYIAQENEPTVARAYQIGQELCRLKRLRFEEFSAKLSSKPPADVLKIIAQINGNRRSRSSSLQDTQEALSEYAEYFASMTTNSLPEPASRIAPVALELNHELAGTLAERIFTTGIIFNILMDLPWNKTAGNSGVCYDLIKAADLSIVALISRWFRILFRIGLVPASWTRSMIVPVPKKGDLNNIKNYRPISLTESFRKIFEHCLVRYLTVIAGPMHFSQGGFRSDHCCSDMISTLHEVLSKNKNMHVAFLDIKAAYDSVDRSILWSRCRDRSFDDGTIRILQRLFDHNSAQVVVNGRRSNPFGIKAGLLQGSVLSPFLYSIFIDDLAKELMCHSQVTVGNFNLNCTMYADDVAVFARSAQVLQMLLLHCSRHANMNRYRFNVQKCMVIGDAEYNYTLNGNTIPKVDTFIYLGVEVGRKGIIFKEFIDRRCKSAVDAGMKLVGMGMNLGGFSPQIASMLYKVFIRSKLEAGICLIPQNQQFIKKLEAAQRKILARFFFCGPNSSGTIVRSLMNAPTMAFRMKFLRSRYVHRVEELYSEHVVRSIMNNSRCFLNKLKKCNFSKDECNGNGRERLKLEEMQEVHATTCAATRGHLVLPADGKLPWFLRKAFDPILRKRICHWILKKYPAAAPGRCGRCGNSRCYINV